jgi:hypothetical protein
MSEHDQPVNVDENGGADWLRDEDYRRRELAALELAKRLHDRSEQVDDRRRRRRTSWESFEDFGDGV